MKTDFSVNVQVNVGFSPEVVELFKGLLVQKSATPQLGASNGVPTGAGVVAKDIIPATKMEAPTEGAAVAATSKEGSACVEAEQGSITAPAEGAIYERKAEAPKPQEVTIADVRAAMDRTRRRIEGEDYKEHTDSEAYQKYHRMLTGMFKRSAALLGSDLPSQLPPEQRQAFIDECDQWQIQGDGSVSKGLAF